MLTQAEKGVLFEALHQRDGIFIIPNPYDVGTARLLENLGFEALATSSAGYAFTMGKPDNAVGRDGTLAHAEAIAATTNLPLSIDLENGFGDTPEVVAKTIRLAAGTGAVGGSIEDATGRDDEPIYDRALAIARIRAAADVVRELPFPFMLTARAENFLVGRQDLNDTIERLQAYQEAGANVLYAPGLTSKDDIATLVRSVDRPVNALMGLQGVKIAMSDLAAIGVKRVSVGSGLARCALGAFLRAAEEMRDDGTFSFAENAEPYRALNSIFADHS